MHRTTQNLYSVVGGAINRKNFENEINENLEVRKNDDKILCYLYKTFTKYQGEIPETHKNVQNSPQKNRTKKWWPFKEFKVNQKQPYITQREISLKTLTHLRSVWRTVCDFKKYIVRYLKTFSLRDKLFSLPFDLSTNNCFWVHNYFFNIWLRHCVTINISLHTANAYIKVERTNQCRACLK